jgi:hypothetical protein
MLLAGAGSLRDVIAFRRRRRARALFEGRPPRCRLRICESWGLRPDGGNGVDRDRGTPRGGPMGRCGCPPRGGPAHARRRERRQPGGAGAHHRRRVSPLRAEALTLGGSAEQLERAVRSPNG